jgi:hypothetical protein
MGSLNDLAKPANNHQKSFPDMLMPSHKRRCVCKGIAQSFPVSVFMPKYKCNADNMRSCLSVKKESCPQSKPMPVACHKMRVSVKMLH